MVVCPSGHGLGCGVFRIGFFSGVFSVPPLFVAVFLFMEAEMPPFRAIVCSLIASAALYGGAILLRIDLWMGAIPKLIPGILGGSIIPPL